MAASDSTCRTAHGEVASTPRPLVAPAAAMAAGILAGRMLSLPPWLWLVAAALPLAALVATLRARAPQVSRWAAVAAALTAAILGAAWVTTRTQVGPRSIARLAGDQSRLVTVDGVLVESPRPSRRPPNPLLMLSPEPGASTAMVLNVTAAVQDGRRTPADGRLRVTVGESLPDQPPGGTHGDMPWPPRTGDRFTVTGLLRTPSPPLNPGQVDIREVYATRGIHAALRTDYWGAVRLRRPPWWSAYGWMGRFRARLRAMMPRDDTALARILPALFLADRSELAEADEQAFIHAGVLHYLAVSGIHVAILAGVLIGLLRLALVGPRVRGLCLMVFVVAYAMATELRPSVVRAGTFFLLLSASWLFGRRRDLLNTLAAAAGVVLILNPADLFNAGFQLSFLVALGLMTVCPRLLRALFGQHPWTRYAEMSGLRRALWRVRTHLENAVSTCLTAWLVAAPLAAWHFHVVAPVGVVATVVLFPLVFGLLLLGALGAAAALVGLPAGPLAVAMTWLAEWLEALVGLFARVPCGHVYVRRFAWPWVAVALALLAAWAYRDRLGLSRRRLAAALAVAVAGYLWLGVPRGPADEVRVTTLAIGSGNTVLVQSPGGHSLLVDCGSNLLAEHTAQWVTVPALWRLGVSRLDAVILTHADADHIKDLPPVLERIPTKRVYLSGHFATDEKTYDDRALDWLAAERLDVQSLVRGDTVPAPEGMEIRVLSPPAALPTGSDTNATSVVLKITYKGRSMILTGDATPSNLTDMVAAGGLTADAVLLPHHGEQSPALARFLDATGARIAVMSAGRYRDARRKPVITWPQGLRLLKTYRDGAVSVLLGAEGVRVETFAGRASP